MTDSLIIALAQTDPTVGDVEGNVDAIRTLRAEATGARHWTMGPTSIIGLPIPAPRIVVRAFFSFVPSIGTRKIELHLGYEVVIQFPHSSMPPVTA